jgi:hypothetical protein
MGRGDFGKKKNASFQFRLLEIEKNYQLDVWKLISWMDAWKLISLDVVWLDFSESD